MAKRFTFADAKKKINDLEKKLEQSKKKAANLILNTEDNVFTSKELEKIRFLELWAIIGPIAGVIAGVLIGMFI
tara:strand:+ start:21 stop:242 length:222 start_codon:yes stop_codon:yes gene_type:complete